MKCTPGGKRIITQGPTMEDGEITGDDADFIAAARSDVPALVKALRQASDELRNIVDADLAGMRKDFGADTDRQFRKWAQNCARATLAQLLREPAEEKK